MKITIHITTQIKAVIFNLKLESPSMLRYDMMLALLLKNVNFPFGPGGLRAPCIAWPLLFPSFSLSFFPLFLLLLLLTHSGETPEAEHLFPPIFWHNWKIYAKKKF